MLACMDQPLAKFSHFQCQFGGSGRREQPCLDPQLIVADDERSCVKPCGTDHVESGQDAHTSAGVTGASRGEPPVESSSRARYDGA